MPEFTSVADSGAHQDFETGARRDSQENKPLYGLIPAYPLYRLAMHYTNGAKKYDPNNWTKGIPMSRTWESLERHVQAFKSGDKEEDHLAAIAWNAFALMWYEERMPEMNDLAEYLCWPEEWPQEGDDFIEPSLSLTQHAPKALRDLQSDNDAYEKEDNGH